MTIQIGKTQVSMLNPPNEGIVIEDGQEWNIGRNYRGMIVLRKGTAAHIDFFEGMDMLQFCCWINEKCQ